MYSKAEGEQGENLWSPCLCGQICGIVEALLKICKSKPWNPIRSPKLLQATARGNAKNAQEGCYAARNGVELGEGYAEIAASLKDKKP